MGEGRQRLRCGIGAAARLTVETHVARAEREVIHLDTRDHLAARRDDSSLLIEMELACAIPRAEPQALACADIAPTGAPQLIWAAWALFLSAWSSPAAAQQQPRSSPAAELWRGREAEATFSKLAGE